MIARQLVGPDLVMAPGANEILGAAMVYLRSPYGNCAPAAAGAQSGFGGAKWRGRRSGGGYAPALVAAFAAATVQWRVGPSTLLTPQLRQMC
jgi:hypothetical protein